MFIVRIDFKDIKYESIQISFIKNPGGNADISLFQKGKTGFMESLFLCLILEYFSTVIRGFEILKGAGVLDFNELYPNL